MSDLKFFKKIEEPNSAAVFRNLPGLIFDETRWQIPELGNIRFRLPGIEEIDLSAVPKEYYQSGILSPRSLDLEEINFLEERGQRGWYPGVRIGEYSVFGKDYFLHGEESVYDLVDLYSRGAFPEHGVSSGHYLDLLFDVNIYTRISVGILKRNLNDFSIDFSEKWEQVARFTREAEDGSETSEVDTSKKEFLVAHRDHSPVTIRLNSTASRGAGVGEFRWKRFDLEDLLVQKWWKPTFSRPDIFRNEVSSTTEWLELFRGGELAAGEFSIGYNRRDRAYIYVLLTPDQVARDEYGSITLKPENSAKIVFNQLAAFVPGGGQGAVVTETRNVSIGRGVEYYLPFFPVGGVDGVGVTVDDVQFKPVEGTLGQAKGRVTTHGIFASTLEEYSALIEASEDFAIDDKIYELDRLTGILRFGQATNAVPGAFPEEGAVVKVYYHTTPIVQYEPSGATHLFYDKEEDLDPLRNSIKQGFLVLDNKKLKPYRIVLTTAEDEFSPDTCIFGPLSVPPLGSEDFGKIRARVEARSNEGVPNTPVEFFSLDGLMDFTQKTGVTDADGNVYSEAFGKGQFRTFMTEMQLFDPSEPALGNDLPVLGPAFDSYGGGVEPAEGHSFDWIAKDPLSDGDLQQSNAPGVSTPHWIGNVLSIDGRLEAAPEEVYLFVTSEPRVRKSSFTLPAGESFSAGQISWLGEPDDSLAPWDRVARKGGVSVIWSAPSYNIFDGADPTIANTSAHSPRVIIHPVEIRYLPGPDKTLIIFNRALPLPFDWNVSRDEGDFYFQVPDDCLIRSFTLAVDRTATIQARMTLEPVLTSNVLSFMLKLNNTMQGQFRLFDPSDPTVTDGTRIDSATFLSVHSPILLIDNVYDENGASIGLVEGRIPLLVGGTLRTVKIHAIEEHADDGYTLVGDVSREISTTLSLPSPETNMMNSVNTGNPGDPITEQTTGATTELKLPVFIIGINDVTKKIDKAVKILPANVSFERITNANESKIVVVTITPQSTVIADAGTGPHFLSIGGFHPGDYYGVGAAERNKFNFLEGIPLSSIPVSLVEPP